MNEYGELDEVDSILDGLDREADQYQSGLIEGMRAIIKLLRKTDKVPA